MKILLLGNYTVAKQHSMLGFSGALFSGLRARGVETRIIAPSPVLGKLPVKRIHVAKWLWYGDRYLLFPPTLKKAIDWADLVHICDQGNAIYIRHMAHKPHLVTCHDVLAIRSAQGSIPGWTTGRTGRFFQRMILAGLDRANYVVCDTEATQRDLLNVSCVPKEKTVVRYIGFTRPFAPMPETESAPLLERIRIAPREPFLMHLGGNQFYKNRQGVLSIFAALRHLPQCGPMRLVMAGQPFTAEMRKYVEAEGLADSVLERSGLDDETIRALYSRARALLFPSLYEGFGLPIIEAQACDCPVFTSDQAPMTEVGGAAAVYFDPTRPRQAAQVIADHLNSTDAMIAAGRENIHRFTTARMLDDYLAAYHHLLGRSA